MSALKKSALIIIGILILDQILKIWVKTHMFIGESSFEHWGWGIKWAQLRFTENNGMAFGMELGGEFGKIALTLFRMVASIVIAYYIYILDKKKAHFGLILSLSLIFAGAVGNIIDSAFYGIIFGETGFYPGAIAQAFPEGGGYSSFLHGKVVDMLYFPMIQTTLPEWVPFRGGTYFEFFSPIFNIADSAITVGVFIMLIFQNRFFANENKTKETEKTVAETGLETEIQK